jgi:hypothetical protein
MAFRGCGGLVFSLGHQHSVHIFCIVRYLDIFWLAGQHVWQLVIFSGTVLDAEIEFLQKQGPSGEFRV